MNIGSQDRRDTDLLRALAIILVVNSHLDVFYPVAHLGTGGALGNAIFFALSAYGLIASSREHQQSLKEWVSRRFWRIYPSVWVALAVYWLPLRLLDRSHPVESFLQVVGNAFYPPFWFLQILLLVYPLAFLLTRFHKPQASVLCFCGGVALYGYIYFQYVDLTVWSVETLPFKTISCVLIFIFGALLAKLRRIEYHGILDVIALCGSIGVIYLHKFAMANGLLFSCQFLQQAMLVPFVYYALKVSRAPSLQRHLAQHPFVLGGISFISSRTIEIYMVHTTIRDGVANLGFAFPVNVFILLAATAVLVVLTEWMSRRLRSWLLSL